MEMLKIFFLIFVIHDICNAQDTNNINDRVKFLTESNFSLERVNEITKYSKTFEQKNIGFGTETIEIKFFKTIVREKQSFDLMSAVGNNISFGGFWDRYAIINFTPQMDIKPVSFISFYANHNLNCLVPINGIKEYYQTVLIQSIAILAIDKSVNLILNSNSWIKDVIAFAAKNLIINLLIKPSIDNSSKTAKPILQFENYYYSVKIIF